MVHIHLRDLVKVSNNSIITREVHQAINKLSDKEKRDFLEWLRIVNRKNS